MANVLIIDDDPGIVRIVSLVLTTEEIEVRRAYSGEEGMAQPEAGHVPDLILLDLSMPGMGGKQFFVQARAAGFEGPIIFCSAYGASAANTELGGQGAIEKPFEPEDLVMKVRSSWRR